MRSDSNFTAPLRSLMWFDNNCLVNAALHAAAGLGLLVQRGSQDDKDDGDEDEEIWDEEGGQ